MGAPLVPLYSLQPSRGLGVHVLKGGGVWYGKSVEGPDVQPEPPREGAAEDGCLSRFTRSFASEHVGPGELPAAPREGRSAPRGKQSR